MARTLRLPSPGPLHPPAPQPASAGARFAYERHRPEETTLYRVVQEELETFLARVEAQTGSGLPQFVKDEFEAYLECGILAHGFLQVRCAECANEKLVVFSCKRRGFCPSCGARRMAETAAVLVDRVMPRVPVRQWVLSFPIPLRIRLAAHPGLLTPVLGIVHRVITGFLVEQAGPRRGAADAGRVTLIQRFGSAGNLNIHLHCLVLDGVVRRTEGEPVSDAARAPTGADLAGLLGQIIARLMKLLTRSGHLVGGFRALQRTTETHSPGRRCPAARISARCHARQAPPAPGVFHGGLAWHRRRLAAARSFANTRAGGCRPRCSRPSPA